MIEGCHEAIQDHGVAAVSVQEPEALVVIAEVQRSYVRKLDELEVAIASIRKSVSREFQLVIHHVVLIKPGQLPKTSSGKVQRHLSKQTFLAQAFDAIASSSLS